MCEAGSKQFNNAVLYIKNVKELSEVILKILLTVIFETSRRF